MRLGSQLWPYWVAMVMGALGDRMTDTITAGLLQNIWLGLLPTGTGLPWTRVLLGPIPPGNGLPWTLELIDIRLAHIPDVSFWLGPVPMGTGLRRTWVQLGPDSPGNGLLRTPGLAWFQLSLSALGGATAKRQHPAGAGSDWNSLLWKSSGRSPKLGVSYIGGFLDCNAKYEAWHGSFRQWAIIGGVVVEPYFKGIELIKLVKWVVYLIITLF